MTATDKTSCIAHRQNIRFFVMFSDFLEVASVSKEHQHKLAAFWRVLETKTNERILSNDDKKIPNTPEHLWIEIPYSEFVSRSLRIYKASAFQIAAAESERLGFSKSRVLKRPTNKDNPDSPLEDYKEYYFCTEVMQSVINGGAYPTPIENNSTLLKSIAIRKERKAVENNTTGIENNRGNAIESNRDGIENNKKKYSKESNKKNKEVEESVSVAATPTPSSDDEDAHSHSSSLSSQPERTSAHATHSPAASPAAALVAAAELRSGDATGSQTNQPGVDTAPLIAIGEGTTHPKQEKVTRKPRAPKPLIEEEARGPAPKPQMPDAAMVWGTRKCLLKFDAWREAKLIVRHKIIQASECAKALAETYTEEQVERVYAAMNADAYYVERGGADIFDVASNIAKYLKKLERKLVALPPIPSPSVPPGPRPLTDLQAHNKALREKYGKSAVKEVAP